MFQHQGPVTREEQCQHESASRSIMSEPCHDQDRASILLMNDKCIPLLREIAENPNTSWRQFLQSEIRTGAKRRPFSTPFYRVVMIFTSCISE